MLHPLLSRRYLHSFRAHASFNLMTHFIQIEDFGVLKKKNWDVDIKI